VDLFTSNRLAKNPAAQIINEKYNKCFLAFLVQKLWLKNNNLIPDKEINDSTIFCF